MHSIARVVRSNCNVLLVARPPRTCDWLREPTPWVGVYVGIETDESEPLANQFERLDLIRYNSAQRERVKVHTTSKTCRAFKKISSNR